LACGSFYTWVYVFVFADLNAATESLFILVGIFVGVLWIIDGIVNLTALSQFYNKIWAMILSLISVIAGATLLFSPLWGAVTLWMILGIEFLVVGIIKIIHYYNWNK